jgi:ribosomal protein L11 methyltransferase
MKWIELKITTTSEASDAICEKLIILGADGVTVEDPNEIASIINAPDSLACADEGYIESLGSYTTIKTYFAELADGIRLGIKEDENRNFESTDVLYQSVNTRPCTIEELLSLAYEAIADVGQYLPTGEGSIVWRYVADEDWANCWKKYYQTLRISDRAVICPSWETYEPRQGEVLISLDPGSAFGTGTHATTAMCAQLLDKELRMREGEVRVLDLGCGSGILSVIAAKLGAAAVDAVDIDQIAVDVASENCRINHVQETVHCKKGEIQNIGEAPYQIILANIIADVIASIAPDVPERLTADGIFITSGIINTKKERVLEACSQVGLVKTAEMEKDDWIAFVFKKSS